MRLISQKSNLEIFSLCLIQIIKLSLNINKIQFLMSVAFIKKTSILISATFSALVSYNNKYIISQFFSYLLINSSQLLNYIIFIKLMGTAGYRDVDFE